MKYLAEIYDETQFREHKRWVEPATKCAFAGKHVGCAKGGGLSCRPVWWKVCPSQFSPGGGVPAWQA